MLETETGRHAAKQCVQELEKELAFMNLYVCIDIGGTSIKYGLANAAGEFVHKASMPTEVAEKGAQILPAKIQKIVEGYRQEGHVPVGIAISTAGMVDPESGCIVYAGTTFRGYTGMKLSEIIEMTLGLPCTVENDVNAAGLGELWLGAGRGARSLFCLTVGTGIGGCVIIDGKLLHGAGNCAGEIGYMDLGGAKSFQHTAAASCLVCNVAEAKGLPVSEVDGCKVFEWAKAGDEVSVQAIDEMITCLAKGIANVCYVLNPEVVILGGGIMAQEAYIRPRLLARLEKKMVPRVFKTTRIAFAERQNDAGMLGALYNFLQRKENEQEESRE